MGESDGSSRRSQRSPTGDPSGDEEGERGKHFRVETVHGEPYEVGGRRLIPVARITSYGKARATIGTKQVSGLGGRFVQVTPLAVVDETPEGERRIDIADRTSRAMLNLVLGAVVTVLVLGLIRWLAGRNGAGTHSSEETGE